MKGEVHSVQLGLWARGSVVIVLLDETQASKSPKPSRQQTEWLQRGLPPFCPASRNVLFHSAVNTVPATDMHTTLCSSMLHLRWKYMALVPLWVPLISPSIPFQCSVWGAQWSDWGGTQKAFERLCALCMLRLSTYVCFLLIGVRARECITYDFYEKENPAVLLFPFGLLCPAVQIVFFF